MAATTKKPAKELSEGEAKFPEDTTDRTRRVTSKKPPVPLRPPGWKTQGSGKRLPLKHHK